MYVLRMLICWIKTYMPVITENYMSLTKNKNATTTKSQYKYAGSK